MPSVFSPWSSHVYYASRVGATAISPSSPQSGSASTTALQTILNLGQSSYVTLIIDIPVRAQNLLVYSGTTIVGLGAGSGATPSSGIWMDAITNGTNTCILRNANWRSNYQQSNPLPCNITDQDITIRDLHLDGQRRNGASGNVTYPIENTSGTFVSPIQFYGVTNPRIENVNIYDPCCYHLHVANIQHGVFRDILFYDPTWAASPGTSLGRDTDGLHINGPATDLRIDGLYGTTGDDMLAFNGADGHLSTGTVNGYAASLAFGGGYSSVYYGDIRRVYASGIYPNQCRHGVRFLVGCDPRGGGPTCTTDDVTVEGLRGSTTAGFLMGYSESYLTLTGSLKKKITLRDWQCDPTGPGSDSPIGYQLGGNWTNLEMINHQWSDLQNNTTHQVNLASDATVGRLAVDLKIREDSSEVASVPSPVSITQGTVDTLVLSGEWSRNATSSVALATISGGTVNRAVIAGVEANNINNVLSITGGTVGGVTSRGLTHRGANSNPSINVGTGVTLARLRAADSDTALLVGGAGTVTSKKTDGTEDS